MRPLQKVWLSFSVVAYNLAFSSVVVAASNIENVGSHIRIAPHTELHLLTCQTILQNAAFKKLVPETLRFDGANAIPYLPVVAVAGTYNGSSQISPERSEIAPRDVMKSYVAQEIFADTPVFNKKVDYGHNAKPTKYFGVVPKLLTMTDQSDFDSWIEAKIDKELRDFGWEGFESFLLHAYTPDYVFPVRYSRQVFEGRVNGRRAAIPNRTSWQAVLEDPIKRDDALIKLKTPTVKSPGGTAKLQKVIPLDAEDLRSLPASIRNVDPNQIFHESIGYPQSVDGYNAFINNIDNTRDVGTPTIYRVLNDDNLLETRAFMMVFQVKDSYHFVDASQFYRTHGRQSAEQGIENHGFEYRIFFDAEGRRLSSTKEARLVQPHEFRKLENVLMYAGERLKIPVYGKTGEKGNTGHLTDDLWQDLMTYMESQVTSVNTHYTTDTDPKFILKLLEDRAKNWSDFEKQSLVELKQWVGSTRLTKAFARTVEFRSPKETRQLEEHFLFVSDRHYLYFRLPTTAE